MFWRKRLPAIVKKLKRFNAHRLVDRSYIEAYFYVKTEGPFTLQKQH